ncbi:MAG: sel1 repeat family protein [Sutterellaceae bacterium]|nr:sel1 repeat family protein [Sutterellaceae bacterium]MDD7442373.1 tetratricopeptide repeat protein [Sutterellaceae bacterium]MDY2867121.1 tetratricopeptide repeat protein [Mesosutterella sp.]
MRTFQIFLFAAALLVAVVWFTAGRANRPAGPADSKIEVLVDEAEKGSAEASFELSARNAFGIRGVDRNWKDAYYWAGRAAEAGSADGLAARGAMESTGLGAPLDTGLGASHLAKAAGSGNLAALYVQGVLEAFGQGAGATGGQSGLGKIRKAADGGFARAQYALGLVYRGGLFGVPKDPAEAMRWMEKAAKQADPDACGTLGAAYMKGDGVSTSFEEAWSWLAAAADTDPRWEKLSYEARNSLNTRDARDNENAVIFSRREYGKRKFRPSPAALAAEEGTGFPKIKFK